MLMTSQLAVGLDFSDIGPIPLEIKTSYLIASASSYNYIDFALLFHEFFYEFVFFNDGAISWQNKSESVS